ncbi:centrosomal protein POC5 [Brachionichthys hirsutus]|uniref:centrosomal protein POC5 n=1 Tax=Brachionichthys hirsutus TaxID=412623 RepID=UPI00360537F4
MSSEEEEPSRPVRPQDSDRGSSVSSELQDEYEELLRYAVVTPKLETLTRAQAKQPGSSGILDNATVSKDGLHSRRTMASQASPLIVEPSTHARASHAEEMTGPSSRASMVSNPRTDNLKRVSENQFPLESSVTEIFISEENISKMENILDMWSNNLKSNVLTELRKWKVAFNEQHNLEMKKERQRCAAQTADLQSELEGLKELLNTYETSNQRKDEVIRNLSQVLDRQKEKLEKMRTFTHWRLKHTEAKEEALAAQAARQHYNSQLKKKVWLGWHSLVQKHWKLQVEQACRARAEEVCTRMSTEYEAKLAEHCEAIDKAQTEILRLRLERERYGESMKKAFMRGVCALNIEALGMFGTTEGRQEQPPVCDQHDIQPPQDEPGSTTLTQLQSYPISSTRFSPVHFDHPDPACSEVVNTRGSVAPVSRAEALPPTTVVYSGTSAGSHKQVGGRAVSSGQQKSKTVTARLTARNDARSNLQVMGVAPPMSSVIVERHHPVTQLTIGQATAAKFPHSSQQGHGSTAGRSSSRTQSGSCHVHGIKIVD